MLTYPTYSSYYSYNPGVDDITAGYQKRYADAMAQLANWGNQQKADESQRWANVRSRGIQDLINRGITGSTIMPSVRSGIARQESNAMNRLNESLNAQKLRYQTELSGDLLGYQANARQQAYSNALAMMQLAQNQQRMNSSGSSSSSSGTRYPVSFVSNYQPYQLGSSFGLPTGRSWWSGLS